MNNEITGFGVRLISVYENKEFHNYYYPLIYSEKHKWVLLGKKDNVKRFDTPIEALTEA